MWQNTPSKVELKTIEEPQVIWASKEAELEEKGEAMLKHPGVRLTLKSVITLNDTKISDVQICGESLNSLQRIQPR